MNNTARQILSKRMSNRDNSWDSRRDNYNDNYSDHNDYNQDNARRGDRNSDNRRDYARGYADGRQDAEADERRNMSRRSRDGHMRLSKDDMADWKHHLQNEDGTTGPHFSMQEVMSAANKVGIMFDNYDEAEFCMTMNMRYSDDCKALRDIIPPDREAYEYAKLAKCWLEDKDASATGSEKLAVHYYCVVAKD